MRFKEFLTETPTDEASIREFLNKTLGLDDSDFIINQDKSVSLHTDLNIDPVHGQSLKRLPVKFKEIDGDVWINNCKLETLIGLPEVVENLYLINTFVKDLKFAPKTFYGDLVINNNRNLKSLAGCPTEVPGDFSCCDNHELESLVGGPTTVGKSYKIDTCNSLKSIEGIAETIGKHLSICNNRKLDNLEGINKKVKSCGGKLDVSGNYFTHSIMGVVVVKGITSLEYKFGGKASKAFDIIFKCRTEGKDALECQDLLIDAGLQDFAKL